MFKFILCALLCSACEGGAEDTSDAQSQYNDPVDSAQNLPELEDQARDLRVLDLQGSDLKPLDLSTLEPLDLSRDLQVQDLSSQSDQGQDMALLDQAPLLDQTPLPDQAMDIRSFEDGAVDAAPPLCLEDLSREEAPLLVPGILEGLLCGLRWYRLEWETAQRLSLSLWGAPELALFEDPQAEPLGAIHWGELRELR